jgi:toluene monooxygenase electron transfer component
MSTWLSERHAGDDITVEAPYGDMWIRPGDRDLLFIAGGTGISAVLSLATEVAVHHRHRQLTVLYGARTPDDLVLLEELRELVAGHGHGQVLAYAESGAESLEGLFEGRVTQALGNCECSQSDVYLAGPPAMVDAADEALADLGVQRDRLFVDRFG